MSRVRSGANRGMACALNAGLETSLALSITGPRLAQPRGFMTNANQLDERGVWIGRAPDCAVALDDPDRFVSLYHARLAFANGGFWLADQSTNGTIVLGAGGAAQTRLSKGERYRLASGDRVRVGMFEIAVRVGEGTPDFAAMTSPLDAVTGDAPVVPRDPLADFAGSLPGQRGRDAAIGGIPATGDAGRGGADPFDVLLAELAGPADAAPLAHFPVEAMPSAPPPAAAPSTAAPPAAMVPVAPPQGDRSADMLDAITSEVADSAPALRSTQVVAESGRAQRDTATMALAAFWCGLGIIPRSLQPDELVEVMAELGVAFREATDGFAAMARDQGPDGADAANPFATGHSGLRRYLDARGEARLCLDDAVREIFARAGERDAIRQAATRAGVQAMAKSLSAAAIEQRIGVTVAARRPRARRAELWRIFTLMQEDLAALAELRFYKEVEERVRRAGLRSDQATGGFDL